ncbi:MAG: cell division protein FtsQ/DivIB [Bacteroidetes bacterium]|nr:cell division protein FtsQ/DivIB [Bacteroidota bacterium]
MKARWSVIKIVGVLVLLGVCYGFTQERNSKRKLVALEVQFTDENSPFITLNTVNKLLIQNEDSVTSITKETLVLNEMESRLLQNPMVSDAQVFVSVDGKLGANIEQRNPIARVAGSPNYYVDEDGREMPLSEVYTARVPLISGISKKNFTELTPLLLKIRDDEFMKRIVVGIHKRRNGVLEFKMRKMPFKVRFGEQTNMDKKFQNFKSFYQKAKKDKKLETYNLVDLQFGNQVVATKK